MSEKPIDYAGPTGREKPGEHWNARVIREQDEADRTPAPECQTPRGSWGTCIQALALGWILIGDLCPVCTHVFMRALDRSIPDLSWHQDYLDRATEAVSS